jgi:hypothetical protein
MGAHGGWPKDPSGMPQAVDCRQWAEDEGHCPQSIVTWYCLSPSPRPCSISFYHARQCNAERAGTLSPRGLGWLIPRLQTFPR